MIVENADKFNKLKKTLEPHFVDGFEQFVKDVVKAGISKGRVSAMFEELRKIYQSLRNDNPETYKSTDEEINSTRDWLNSDKIQSKLDFFNQLETEVLSHDNILCDRLIKIFSKNPKGFINMILRNYPIHKQLIDKMFLGKFKGVFTYWGDEEKYEKNLCQNPNLVWTEELIETLSSLFPQLLFFDNPSFPLSLEAIEKEEIISTSDSSYNRVLKYYLTDSILDKIMPEILIVRETEIAEEERKSEEKWRRENELARRDEENEQHYESIRYEDYSDEYARNSDNPWTDVFGEGDEADTAYWNTD